MSTNRKPQFCTKLRFSTENWWSTSTRLRFSTVRLRFSTGRPVPVENLSLVDGRHRTSAVDAFDTVDVHFYWCFHHTLEKLSKFLNLCYSTLTCKVLLNQPHSKLGQHCAARSLILTRRNTRIRAYLALLVQSSHLWIRMQNTHLSKLCSKTSLKKHSHLRTRS